MSKQERYAEDLGRFHTWLAWAAKDDQMSVFVDNNYRQGKHVFYKVTWDGCDPMRAEWYMSEHCAADRCQDLSREKPGVVLWRHKIHHAANTPAIVNFLRNGAATWGEDIEFMRLARFEGGQEVETCPG